MSEWPMVKLGEVCEVVMGQAPKGIYVNEDSIGTPLIAGAGDFSKTSLNISKWTSKPTKISKKSDLILSIRATIGTYRIADQEYCLGRGVAALRAKGGLNQQFLAFAIDFRKQNLLSKARGATFLQVSKTDIQNLTIPLPPLREQKRIAEILQKSAESIKQIVYEIEGLEKLSLSVADHFIRDEAPDKQPLNELVDFHGGLTPSKKNKDFWTDSGIRWFTSKDLKFDELADSLDHITKKATSETALKPVSEKKSIAISLRGMSLAHRVPMSIIPGDSCVNQDLKALIPKENMDIYVLFTLLKREEKFLLTKVSSSAHGTRKLDFPHIKTLSVPKLEADQICRLKQRLQGIQQLKNYLIRKLILLQELQHSLSARAFAGLL